MKPIARSLLLVAIALRQLPSQTIVTVEQDIREESTRANSITYHPLPLASHWALGSNTFSPDYQLDKIAAGRHVLPCFQMPFPNETVTSQWLVYAQGASLRAASLRLPICFVSTQWEEYSMIQAIRFLAFRLHRIQT